MKNPLTISPRSEAAHWQALVEQYGSPLLIYDAQKVRDQYFALQRALPEVFFYYAIKSLPDAAIIRTLAELGSGFDIASTGEIEMLRPFRVFPRQTIHTHPIKRDADIRAALRFGCTTFVVDSREEMEKFIPYRHRVALLLRVSFRSPDAVVDLSKKFGCDAQAIPALLQAGEDLGIHIKGFSFHVGSQCNSPDMHVQAIQALAPWFEEQPGHKPLGMLDIGGGFPVDYGRGAVDIDAFCAPIRDALAQLPRDLFIAAEPGRFFSAPAVTAVAQVVGRSTRGGVRWYYLDDGVYGSYSGQMFDHACYPLQVFSDSEQRHLSVIAGPTCDSIDVIAEGIELPDLQTGDLVVGHVMGAYTAATATDFNLLPRARLVDLEDLPKSETGQPRLAI